MRGDSPATRNPAPARHAESGRERPDRDESPLPEAATSPGWRGSLIRRSQVTKPVNVSIPFFIGRSGVCESRWWVLSGAVARAAVRAACDLSGVRLGFRAFGMNRPGVHGDAGLAPAVGLIGACPPCGVTRHRPATRFPWIRPAPSDLTSERRIGRDGLQNGLDYVIGVDTHRDSTRSRSWTGRRERCWPRPLCRRTLAATDARRFADRQRPAIVGWRSRRRPLRRRSEPLPCRARRDGARGWLPAPRRAAAARQGRPARCDPRCSHCSGAER